jgi:hypothetical protein
MFDMRRRELLRNGRPPQRKTTPSRGMVSAPSCELKTCTLATCSAWASGHFPTQTVRRDSLLVVGITPTGNRDAARSSGSETLLRSRSLADYTIDTHESEVFGSHR